MARRRLNKKVALIGSAVFAVIAFVSILVILQFSRDSQEYIADAQAALKAAHETTDPRTKKQKYDRAERYLRGAYVKAKDNALREEVLFMMLDMYLETQEWPFIMACWDEIININPDNVKARYGRIRYLHILGKSGTSGLWQRVCEEATEFLKVAEDQEILMEQTSQWDVPGIEQKGDSQQYLGPYLYLLRGIGSLEMASSGAATNKDEMLAQAVNDIKAAQELDPGNIDTYWHLARAVITRGEILASRGNFEEKEKSAEQAKSFLEQAVRISGNNPKAHLNLLQFNLILARDGSSGHQNENIRRLESDYLSVAKKFGTSPDVFTSLSEYYLIYSKYSGPESSLNNLNNAIEAIEKAMSLDESNVVYAINAAELYYRRSSVFKQQADIYKAIDIAKKALTLPEAQDAPGPQHQTRIINRFQLYAFLANCYLEQILDSQRQKSESETKILLSGIEQAVQEIEQILGSKDEPLVIKWRGMLELAKGNRDRFLQIKKDLSIVLHGPIGVKPLNWQKPQAGPIEFKITDSQLEMITYRTKTKETLVITFTNLANISSWHAIDETELQIYGDESDLVKYLVANPNVIEEGFQVIRTEYSTDVGPVDIRGMSESGEAIVEVKKRNATPANAHQLKRYIEYFESTEKKVVRGILVAPEFPKKVLTYLEENNLEAKIVHWKEIFPVINRPKSAKLDDFF